MDDDAYTEIKKRVENSMDRFRLRKSLGGGDLMGLQCLALRVLEQSPIDGNNGEKQ